jgi:hypothetical protein
MKVTQTKIEFDNRATLMIASDASTIVISTAASSEVLRTFTIEKKQLFAEVSDSRYPMEHWQIPALDPVLTAIFGRRDPGQTLGRLTELRSFASLVISFL